jgi:hypothetical protein
MLCNAVVIHPSCALEGFTYRSYLSHVHALGEQKISEINGSQVPVRPLV